MNDSEFAGAAFWPDGTTQFVKLQRPGPFHWPGLKSSVFDVTSIGLLTHAIAAICPSTKGGVLPAAPGGGDSAPDRGRGGAIRSSSWISCGIRSDFAHLPHKRTVLSLNIA